MPADGPELGLRLLYLDLLKAAVLGQLIEDPPHANISHWTDLFRRRRHRQKTRALGRDFPSLAHTMIGRARLDQLHRAIDDVLTAGVPGDLVETGVWRGGATIFMRGALKAYGVTDRRVFVADSFAGLPKPDPTKYPKDWWLRLDRLRILSVPLEEVRANFARYGLLDDQVVFLKGWFKDTLPNAAIERLSILRMDGDLYESTKDALENLYPKLSVGGYAIVDDFNIAACRAAVSDYRTLMGIRDPIVDIDGWGAYWRRSR